MAWLVSSLILAPLALLAIFLAIPPLIIQVRAKNFPASVLLMGVAILNVQNFINAAIWHSLDTSRWWDGKILCDIEVKLYLGIFQAMGGAIASIFRQISIILHPDHIVLAPSPRQRKITFVIEFILCILLPVYVMIGHYLTQRSRYWLRPSTGCVVTFDINYAAPFLTYLWPLVVSLIGSTYCLISILRLNKHRKQMASVLSHTPGATTSRLYRLFGLAFTLLAIYCPLSMFSFVQDVRIPMHKYSWSHIHPPDWSERIFSSQGAAQTEQNITFDRWAQVLTAYLAFIFFGLGQEATQMYKAWIARTCSFLAIHGRPEHNVSTQPPQELVSFEGGLAVECLADHHADEHAQLTHPHHSNISEMSG
jgi:pheromone a factor receptor